MKRSASSRRALALKVEEATLGIRIRSPFDSTESLRGTFKSVFAGKGLERSDSRPCQTGDELSNIDIPTTLRQSSEILCGPGKGFHWGRTIALERLFIKQNVEERRHTAIVVTDASPSLLMGADRDLYGEASFARTKIYLALKLLGFLGYNAIASGFAVGSITARPGGSYSIIKPARTGANLGVAQADLQEAILASRDRYPAAGGLRTALDAAMAAFRFRTFIFVVSDFDYGEREIRGILDAMIALSRRHLVVPCLIKDEAFVPLSLATKPWMAGVSKISIRGEGDRVPIVAMEGRSALRLEIDRRFVFLEGLFSRSGIPAMSFAASGGGDDTSFVSTIESYLSARSRRAS